MTPSKQNRILSTLIDATKFKYGKYPTVKSGVKLLKIITEKE